MNFFKLIDIYVIIQCLILGFMIKKKNTDFQIIVSIGVVTILWLTIRGINIFDSIKYTTLILSVGVVIKLIYYWLTYIFKKVIIIKRDY